MYKAVVQFLQHEYIDGPCEGGQACESPNVEPVLTVSPAKQVCIHYCPSLPQCVSRHYPELPSPLLHSSSASRSFIVEELRPYAPDNPHPHRHCPRGSRLDHEEREDLYTPAATEGWCNPRCNPNNRRRATCHRRTAQPSGQGAGYCGEWKSGTRSVKVDKFDRSSGQDTSSMDT